MAVLHREFYRGTGNGQGCVPVNQDIRRYIEQTPDGDFSFILADDGRWPVFYHLSEMRASILNWYEWKEDARVLEIGGEFGALTGLLCERCQYVATVEYGLFKAESIERRYRNKDNLHIYAGNLMDMEFTERFDYVVMVGSLERQCGGSQDTQAYVAYLKQIRSLLQPQGKLLVAVDNRYGLRYFCGDAEPYTGKPFAGINHYPSGSKGYTFSRQEIKDMLEGAGFQHTRFYYPLPDYKLAQMVYSDEYPPQKDLGERLLFYHARTDTLLVPEQQLYADLIDNHVFPFFANSFLTESGMSEQETAVIFAAVTTDRGKEHGLATSVQMELGGDREWQVKKRPLYPEGTASIQDVYENMMDLKQRGVPIVPHVMDRGALVMPYMPQATCSDYLRQLVAEKERGRFEHIFELIYENIRKSSEAACEDENALLGAACPDIDYGPILRRCYLDMVPFNCFYVDGRLLYFDQEFVKENYPASYPMYRALMYTYAFTPGAEELVPLQEMRDRYGLSKLWDIYRKEEDRFVFCNRRYDVYRNFYRWTEYDIGRMYRNAEMLGAEDGRC